MNLWELEQIEPKEEVTIRYKDVSIGTYEMNLRKNQLVNYHENSETCRILNNPLHQLGQNDLKEFLEDHIKGIGRDSKNCAIDEIRVDGHAVFLAKDQTKVDTILSPNGKEEFSMNQEKLVPGAELISLPGIEPKNSVVIRYSNLTPETKESSAKGDVSRMSLSPSEFIPSENGEVHLWMMDYEGPRGPVTSQDLKNFLRYAISTDNDLVREGKPNDIQEIEVDGKRVFDLSQESNKTVVLGAGKDEEGNMTLSAVNGMGKELAYGVFPKEEKTPSISQQYAAFKKAMQDASYVVGIELAVPLLGLKKVNIYLPKTKPYVECMNYSHVPSVQKYIKERAEQRGLTDARKEAAALLAIYHRDLQKIVMRDRNAQKSLDEILEPQKEKKSPLAKVNQVKRKSIQRGRERI